MVKKLGFSLVLFLFGGVAWGQSSSAVLPKGIWHPSLRLGYISEVTNRYDNTGSLQSIGRLNLAFNGENIGRYNRDFGQLTDFLNQTYPHSGYANQLSLGSLEFEANASVRYIAPLLAYGINKRWSVGVGVPVVTFESNVEIRQAGVNNARAVCQQISGDVGALSAELEKGCRQMETSSLVGEFYQALDSRGFERPSSARETVLGDVQVASIFQYFENRDWTLYQESTANLPTGPEDDPDDLLDLPIFHQTSLKLAFHQDYRVMRPWTVGSVFSYTWRIPDTLEKRVPSDENDFLPGPERKERVRRDLGDSAAIGLKSNYWFNKIWNVSGGYEYSAKGPDYYSGDRGYSYGLLSKETAGFSHRYSLGITYSTIDLYLLQEFPAPIQVSYLFSDLFYGVNVDRQVSHELALKMFF